MGVTALVLAGDRGPDEPLTVAAGVSCKAFVPIAGEAMVMRVLRTVAAARSIDEIVLCGPEESRLSGCPALIALIASGDIRWVAPQATPSRSVLAALETIAPARSVLVTTADHALLTAPIVDAFQAGAEQAGGDVAVAVAPHALVAAAFPGVKRTAFRLRDGAWCGCNLFYLRTAPGRRAADFWRRVERERKSPLRIARTLGWSLLWRLLLRRLTLERGLARVGRLMGLELACVVQRDAQAAVDVDTVADWQLVKRVLGVSERT